jgi:hypothetical protein
MPAMSKYVRAVLVRQKKTPPLGTLSASAAYKEQAAACSASFSASFSSAG